MKRSIFLALALSFSTAAIAEGDLAIKSGAMLKTAEGRRVGVVDRVVKDGTGAITFVKIIYDSRIIAVPYATLSSGDKGLVTSLTPSELRKL